MNNQTKQREENKTESKVIEQNRMNANLKQLAR
jgi:hypothetical protein